VNSPSSSRAGARRFAIRPELIDIRPADTRLPDGLSGADGTLEDVLYHGSPAAATCGWMPDGARRRTQRVGRRNPVATAGHAGTTRVASR